MVVLTGDFMERFSVQYAADWVYLNGKAHPAGELAMEYLNEIPAMDKLPEMVKRLEEDTLVYLCAHTVSSAAVAQDTMGKVWEQLGTMPVYHDFYNARYKPDLFTQIRTNPVLLEYMLDKDSEERAALNELFEKLEQLPEILKTYREQMGEFYREFFSEPKQLNASEYAAMYEQYLNYRRLHEYDFVNELEDEDAIPPDERYQTTKDFREELEKRIPEYEVTVTIGFAVIPDPEQKGKMLMAEEIQFTDLVEFLKLDFMRGLQAGHIPRRCANCGRFFLLTKGYDIIYCSRPDPQDRKKRPCRVTGPQKKMKAKQKKRGAPKLPDGLRQEYARAYNRLKKRHSRGTLTDAEWYVQTEKLAKLRDRAARGGMSIEVFCKECGRF